MISRPGMARPGAAEPSDAPAVPKFGLSEAQARSIGQATSKINLWHGSVRSGKTIASLMRWLMFVATAPPSGELVVTGKTLDTISRNIFSPLTDPTITGAAASMIQWTRGAPTATILGRKIEVISANDSRAEGRLRGLTCAGAYVDEATLLAEDFWTQLLARCSVRGSMIFATTNPGPPNHWLRKNYLQRADETETRAWHFTIDDNPHLDPAYVSWLKSTYTGLFYKRFVLGEWCLAEGSVYDMWDEDQHVVDILPEIVTWVGLGIDYGTTNPFAALMLGLGIDGNLYLTHEWRYASTEYQRSLTDLEYSQRLRDWMGDLPLPHRPKVRGIRPRFIVVDPSAASFIQQLHRDSLNPYPGDNSVLDGIRLISSLLAAGQLRVHRSCAGWINEVAAYTWDPDEAEKGIDAPIKSDDHSLDAGRYVVKTTEALWRPRLVADAA